MLKNFRAYPQTRPLSRLENNIDVTEIKLKFDGIVNKNRSQSQNNPWRNLKKSNKSPTKQNQRPRANLMRTKTIKAAPSEKIQLPMIKNRKKSVQAGKLRRPQQDFETYCAKGNAVYVDERDAGVKLGHLNEKDRKQEQKNHIGETAYVPFNIDGLKRKVEEKLNMSMSTVHDQTQ